MHTTTHLKPVCLFAALTSFSLSACGGGGGTTPSSPPTLPTLTFDCTNGPACPVINISGDPIYVLPDGKPGPFRGHADPSLRKDPASSRLWLSYSHVGLHTDLVGFPPGVVVTPYVSIHLAHSDDNGHSWTYAKPVWESTLGTDQGDTTDTGYSLHEVSSLTPFTRSDKTEWFGMHLFYFLKRGDPVELRKAASFHHRLTRADTPTSLGSNPEAILTNSLTAPGWGSDLNLTQVHNELNQCTLFSEPALFQDGTKLYLLAECIVLDLTVAPPVRQPGKEFNAVFVTEVGDNVKTFSWHYLGKITDSSVAAELGVSILTQVDIARARDGKLLLLITPTDSSGDGNVAHQGCRVLQIESLNPPRLARNPDNSLIVRADIRSSDAQSSGLCAYDPASDTGVMLVRTHIDLSVPIVEWSLHATGVHP